MQYRFRVYENEKWKVHVKGDFGAFSFFDFRSYLVNPYVYYYFSDKWEVHLGYRILSTEREDKAGEDSFDLLFYGVQTDLIFTL